MEESEGPPLDIVFTESLELQEQLGLTRHQRTIIEHLIAGESQKETAAALGISTNTVHTQIVRAYAKIFPDEPEADAESRHSETEAIARLLTDGYLRLLPRDFKDTK